VKEVTTTDIEILFQMSYNSVRSMPRCIKFKDETHEFQNSNLTQQISLGSLFDIIKQHNYMHNSPMYSAINGRATAKSKNINPNPEIKLVLAAVRTTPSPGNSSIPTRFFFSLRPRANALAYKLVVATFKKANRYKLPSMKVVAGPNAASWDAELPMPTPVALALRPTKLVSTSDNSGPEIHSARQGK
jgi:hypothetical protein